MDKGKSCANGFAGRGFARLLSSDGRPGVDDRAEPNEGAFLG